MVSIRDTQSLCFSSRIWEGRKLLERSNLGPNEFHGAEVTIYGTRSVLMCSALLNEIRYKIYGKEPGPYQWRAKEIYTELRRNIVDNVYNVSSVLVASYRSLRAVTGVRSHRICLGTV
jgi:hypothetical protein